MYISNVCDVCMCVNMVESVVRCNQKTTNSKWRLSQPCSQRERVSGHDVGDLYIESQPRPVCCFLLISEKNMFISHRPETTYFLIRFELCHEFLALRKSGKSQFVVFFLVAHLITSRDETPSHGVNISFSLSG